MKKTIRTKLKQLQDTFSSHLGLQAYKKNNGAIAAHRFWNLFREDLMRQQPEGLLDYLGKKEIKLASCKTGSNDNSQNFPEDLINYLKIDIDSVENGVKKLERRREWQEALILLCLEKDAAWKLNNISDKRKNKLKTMLNIWEVE